MKPLDLPGLNDYDVLVNLKPGDVVVLRLKEGRLSEDRAKLMRETLQDRAPGIEWLVLDSSLDLSVLRPSESVQERHD